MSEPEPEPHLEKFAVRVLKSEWQQAIKLTKARGDSVSAVCRRAIQAYIKRYGDQEK